MKVLFYVRANHAQKHGGDLVQLHNTAEGLKKQGVDVVTSSDSTKDLTRFDLVHIFNSPRFDETKRFFNNAKKFAKPVAFSTIFWSKDELEVGASGNRFVQASRKVFGVKVSARLRRIAKKDFSKENFKIEKRLLNSSDMLLPNSEGEMKEIVRVFKIKNRYGVVRNAIDVELFSKAPSNIRKLYVLSVGRIESRKNTLKLILACNELKFPLVLIGGADAKDPYVKKCLAHISDFGFKYVPTLTQSELIKYYYQAKVHAIVSWYETPGLSSLEAACGGCSIVSTDRGSVKEYFGNEVEYCNPFLQKSIESALQKAWHKTSSLKLRVRILNNFTWEGAAKDTINAYNRVLTEIDPSKQ